MTTTSMIHERPSAELLVPGHVIAQKYRIERTLAEGGMGTVMAGTHLQLDQPVALKFLRGSFRLDPEVLARFASEAKVAAQLKSEYVARVHDAGATDGGTPYIAMEYLEGESLGARVQSHGPLPLDSAAEFVIQACEGLAEAHARGIVHRDVKPYNLFLTERSSGWPAIKILDFGISKIVSAAGNNVATGRIIGSPCYMSPEQLRSTAMVDHRTDIWSLGATLHELLSGRAPFDASLSLAELIAAILMLAPADLRTLRPDVPPGLAAVVTCCLAKDPRERFDSAGALALALLPFAPQRARVPAERAASMNPAQSLVCPEVGSIPPLALTPPEGPKKNGSRGAIKGAAMAAAGFATAAGAVLFSLHAIHFGSTSRVGGAAGSLGAVPLASASGGKASTSSPQTPAPAPDQALSLRAERPSQPSTIELIVRVTPPYAHLSVDDRPVDNPFRALYPRGNVTHRITARAWGFETLTQDVSTAESTMYDLALQPRSTASQPAAHPTAAPVTITPLAVDSPRPPHATTSAASTDPSSDVLDKGGGHDPRRPIDAHDPYAKR
jgi:serine/threonine-protein kinase